MTKALNRYFYHFLVAASLSNVNSSSCTEFTWRLLVPVKVYGPSVVIKHHQADNCVFPSKTRVLEDTKVNTRCGLSILSQYDIADRVLRATD